MTRMIGADQVAAIKGRMRKQPQRTCIGCRQVAGKRGLIRIVRTSTGQVVVDRTGKAPGRGAYLCANKACWLTALTQKRIESALKVALSPQDAEALRAFAAQIPDDTEEPSS